MGSGRLVPIALGMRIPPIIPTPQTMLIMRITLTTRTTQTTHHIRILRIMLIILHGRTHQIALIVLLDPIAPTRPILHSVLETTRSPQPRLWMLRFRWRTSVRTVRLLDRLSNGTVRHGYRVMTRVPLEVFCHWPEVQ